MPRFEAPLVRAGMAIAVLLTFASAAWGQTAPLSPELTPIDFIVGSWIGDQGHAERNQARGTFRIEPAAGGKALLRQDHTQVRSPKGTPLQTFDQIMMIYPENGHLHADYFDGTHAIHYQDAQIEPGRSVHFVTTASSSVPMFRLTYAQITADRISVKFEMMLPGQDEFRTIAEGTARKAK